MMEKSGQIEKTALDWAVPWIEARIPGDWTITVDRDQAEIDAILRLDAHNVFTSIIVEARKSLSPRQAEQMLRGFGRALRSFNPGTALLVLAPWLSERTREILAAEEINYLDETGNARIKLDHPTLFISTEGERRNPGRGERGKARLRGPKAGRLIRYLADVRPPYSPGELAAATSLAPGYVSRLLDTLYSEALIERQPRGPVEGVDVGKLIHRWAESYDVLGTNRAESFVAFAGLDPKLDQLSSRPPSDLRFALTGSFAALRLAPVTAPALLVAYCDRPAVLAEELGLLPAGEGANVVLLEPFDPVVWQGNETEGGLRFAAPAQVAVDCLTGTGRMPAEGEAVLEWMAANEGFWRQKALPDLETDPR